MEPIAMQKLADALCDGRQFPGMIPDICTDTRAFTPGCLFVALEGEHFDGHRFVAEALERGAAAAVVHKDVDAPEDRLLRTPDTQKALLTLAARCRAEYAPRLVAVTGSVGKTTTKEMIACVLSAGWKTLKTEANQNNEIGTSKTLLALDSSYGAAVIEMGMTGFGEIEELALAAKPDMAVITAIGVSHLERLGTRENILQAKLEVTKGLRDGAPLLLCGDNDLLSQVRDPRLEVIFYGIDNPDCTVKCQKYKELTNSTEIDILYDNQTTRAVIPTLGRHNVCNALAAFAVGVRLGLAPEVCARALAGYQPAGMRQRVVEFGGCTVVEDCYNASPDSMRAALETLGSYPCTGRRIAVLSDMLELGSVARESHLESGRLAARHADLLLCWGEQAALYVQAAREAGLAAAALFPTKEALAAAIAQEARPGDLLWFKASHGMALEEVLLCWKKEKDQKKTG